MHRHFSLPGTHNMECIYRCERKIYLYIQVWSILSYRTYISGITCHRVALRGKELIN